MTTRAHVQAPSDTRIQVIAAIRRHSPLWATRLDQAATKQRPIADEGRAAEHGNLFEELKRLLTQLEAQPAPAQDLTRTIRGFMETNLHRGLTLKELAKFLGYSEKYCSDLFQSLMDEPFSQCVKRLRIERAAQLLLDTKTPQAAIAEALGFSDQFAFSHFFKREVGCSPRTFRIRSGNRPSARHGGSEPE
ncbi:MAG: AraC family transcriptional regulator [Nitrospirae bacterium]|nr:MAG: AraC family transcriptional regulator [Nitrospirota bacterium]